MNINEILKTQKDFFNTGKTLDVDYRIIQLKALRRAVVLYQDEISKALKDDLKKCKYEAYTTEILYVIEEINQAIKNLKKWTEPSRVPTPVFLFGSKSFIINEPYGCVLIISPFNYPFQLALSPLIAAIAAGNTAIVKPSKDTKATSTLLSQIIKTIFPKEFIYCIEPLSIKNEELMQGKFDYIFFTGSANTAKKVLRAASEYLTPATLELGGKSPCIVNKDCNVKNTAKSIVWGKFSNCGQTCIAPDYILVHKDVKKVLTDEIILTIKEFYGPIAQESENYGRIINEEHFERLKSIIANEAENLIYGGGNDLCGLYIEPTLLNINSFDSYSMKEEIFGPILPIIEFDNIFDIIKTLKKIPKPLATYVFTDDKNISDLILKELSFGGGSINETMVQASNINLPFGGVGYSGMGQCHGKYGFLSFSHKKSILKKPSESSYKFLYPPYSEKTNSVLRKLTNILGNKK